MIGYPYSPATYSLAARCGAEMIATCLAIYMGEAAVANELLKRTKGNGYGWGFLSFGFGFPFGVVTMMFSHVSAVLNPAALLAQVVLGNVTAGEYFALAASEIVGAFCGAVLMWVHFLPHFNIVPSPPGPEELTAYELLRGTPHVGDNVLNAASYNDDVADQYRRRNVVKSLQETMGDLKKFLSAHAKTLEEQEATLDEVIATAPSARREQVRRTVEGLKQTLAEERGASMSQLRKLETMGVKRPESAGSERTSEGVELPRSRLNPGLDGWKTGAVGGGGVATGPAATAPPPSGLTPSTMERVVHRVLDAPTLTRMHNRPPELPETLPHLDKCSVHAVNIARERALAKYRVEVQLDQNIKLGIFATRPAIYSPLLNFVCEFMCTATLVICANMMSFRANQLFAPERADFSATFGMWLGFLIFLLVLVLGGPTGIAANPARDLGPRIAHFLLPIPGKGPSEFLTYGWIPILATLAGGAAGGGILRAIMLFTSASNLPPDAEYDCQLVRP